ncbi:hypothetical protein ACTAZI_11725 [Legionella bozemanae]|uniref:hypothetical protein n=1 Tax=Legionella bozemanae TaxID=447 RepID=UPI003EE96A68
MRIEFSFWIIEISQERDLLKLPVNTANALRSSEAQIITKASAFLHICLKREHLKLAVAVAFAFALAKVLRTRAIAVKHWAKEGSFLLALLYLPASKRDLRIFVGLFIY